MNGPEHYREAEGMGVRAEEALHEHKYERSMAWYAAAQVHATLALAMAGDTPMSDDVVARAVTAWMGLSPAERTAVRHVSEDLYNALGALSTAHEVGAGR